MATLAQTLEVELILMKGTIVSGITTYYANLKVIFPNEFSKN